MADNQQELRGVNWNEVFSFSHIFKSFRMAIHMSKLLLALAAIVVIFLAGWCMDRIWSVGGGYARVDEISAYFLSPSNLFYDRKEGWLEARDVGAAKLKADTYNERCPEPGPEGPGLLGTYWNILAKEEIKVNEPQGPRKSYFLRSFKANLERELKSRKREAGFESKHYSEFKEDSWSESLSDARGFLAKEIDDAEAIVKDSYKQAGEDIEKDDSNLTSGRDKEEAEEKLEKDYSAALRSITIRKQRFAKAAEAIRGKPVFASLCDYEGSCLSNALSALCRAEISKGMNTYHDILEFKAGRLGQQQAMPGPNGAGFVFWVLAAVYGMKWFICQHWFYAIIFLLISLAAWALFGGAIHRIAALHAARKEKISISQALRFSASKFLSFFFAPLMPLAAILIGGLFLIAGGLIGNLMGFGAIVVGALFILAVLVGLFIAFVAVGLITGVGLMYPTIAVEGSDGFDALSRSFSYVFARPWRAVLYGVVAVIYGALCYIFVRFFAYLALAGAHFLAGTGVWAGGERLREGADRLDVMWEAPTYTLFHAPSNWEAMSTSEAIGSFLISIWVYLIIGLVLAFVLSYAASATTVIYYLLRRKVDATDLDDVYVEEAEEELPGPEQPPAEGPEAPAEGPAGEGEAQVPPADQGPREGEGKQGKAE
ncbi:MAG: SLC5/6 family protein [Planctomycetota bacterium]|jgi:hypothetical protein